MKISVDLDVTLKNGLLILTDSKGKVLTFSRNQVLQKKVSMVTLGELSGLPKIAIARAFGFATRKSYYDARHAVLNTSAEELFPQRTGPKQPTKRTRELEIQVISIRFQTEASMYEIAEQVNRKGFDVSARLVAQILADYGLTKKKLLSPREDRRHGC